MLIPPALRAQDFRFVLIPYRKKAPFEMEWQEKNNYQYNDPKLLSHLSDGGNYGVVCGYGGLVVIDADRSDVKNAVESNLPPTFTVKTGRDGTHYYYICPDLVSPIRLRDVETGTVGHLGDVQSRGKQVVGPNSVHPNGKRYEIINDIAVATTRASMLRFALDQFLKTDTETVGREEREQAVKQHVEIGELRITDVVATAGLKRHGNSYQGAHPVHGSETGMNFRIDAAQNVWVCYRHNTGGGPLSWIAVNERIIDCSDAVPGKLRGELFKRALRIAQERYGLKPAPRARKKKKDEEEVPTPTEMAEDIMRDHTFRTAKDNEELYFYNDGIYHTGGEVMVKEEANERLPEITTHKANEVIFHIKAKTYTPRDEFDKHTLLIHVKNGIFDISKMALIEHTPDVIATSTIPANYDPKVDCPKIKKFFSEVLAEGDVKIMQELFGYCLLKSYIIQRAFMFVGEGANGKSTALSLLRAFLGRGNTASVALQMFESNRFASSMLYGKLANIYADLPGRSLHQTGQFKMLTGGDAIAAERKFMELFSFVNFAKLIFSTNKLPQTFDDTSAFYRRWIILKFLNTFIGDKADKHLLDSLTTEEEMSGLFNWAIEGLKRLLQNGDFSYSLTTEEVRDQYERLSSPLLAFVKDCIDADSGCWIAKDELYAAFISYCQKNNLPTDAKTTVGRELPRYVAVVREEKKTLGNGIRKLVWSGIRFVDQTAAESAAEESKPVEPPKEQKTIYTYNLLNSKKIGTCQGCDKETEVSEHVVEDKKLMLCQECMKKFGIEDNG